MSFDKIVWGSYGDEKVVSTSKIGGLPVGTKMELPDGRIYRHCHLGTDCATAGYLYESPILAVADTMLSYSLVCNTLVVGATAMTITASGSLAFVKDAYAEGFITVASSVLTSGAGYTYKVKANNSAAVGTTCAFSLYESDAVKEATAGGSILALRPSPYEKINYVATNTVVQRVLGVACASAAASTYCWIQTRGVASVKVGATALVMGNPVFCSSTDAAACGPVPVAGTTLLTNGKAITYIGIALTQAAASSYGQVDLLLE